MTHDIWRRIRAEDAGTAANFCKTRAQSCKKWEIFLKFNITTVKKHRNTVDKNTNILVNALLILISKQFRLYTVHFFSPIFLVRCCRVRVYTKCVYDAVYSDKGEFVVVYELEKKNNNNFCIVINKFIATRIIHYSTYRTT